MNSCGIISRVFYRSMNTIKEDNIPFNSLPIEVKELLHNGRNKPSSAPVDYYLPDLFVFNTTYEYQLEDVDMITGKIPSEMWISHYLLIDKTNNITYRINYADFTRFMIIFDKEIFTPTAYNIYGEGTFESLTFDRYSLDRAKLRRKEKKRAKYSENSTR